jgi:putative transposase
MRFIDAENASHPVTMLCRLVDVSRAGYYAWSGRRPSQADAALTEEIRTIHTMGRLETGLGLGQPSLRSASRDSAGPPPLPRQTPTLQTIEVGQV